MPEDFSSYGVPIFYVNATISEPAGGGNVRIWNCARKHGVMVPVCEIIIPATDLITAAQCVSSVAEEVFRRTMMVGTSH